MLLATIGFAFLWFSGNHTDKAQPVVNLRDSITVLQREYAATRSARDSHSKALHSYLLNDAADSFAYSVNHKSNEIEKYRLDWHAMRSDTNVEVQNANKYGASIYLCEYDADWTAGSQGYEDYLSLWPDGPYAEEAWWRGRLHRKLNSCFDAVGSEEETAAFVHDYAEFLSHFPHGKHQREARESLKQFQADLDDSKGQRH